MGENPVPPMPPRLVMVKVPPSISAGVSFFSRAFREARSVRQRVPRCSSCPTSWITGTSRPRSVSTATPMFTYLLVNDFVLRHIDAGVELRKDFQRRRANFERDGGDGHLAAGLLGLRSEARAQAVEFGDVGFVVLRDVRDGVPRLPQMFGGFAANAAHGDALDCLPTWQSQANPAREMRAAGILAPLRERSALGMRFNIIFADAPAGSGAFDLVNIDAEFARQAPHVGRCGNGLAMLGAGNLFQLRGHGEAAPIGGGGSGGSACSSVLPSACIAAWKASRAACCPETCSTGAAWTFRAELRPAFEREDDLSDLDLFALLDSASLSPRR